MSQTSNELNVDTLIMKIRASKTDFELAECRELRAILLCDMRNRGITDLVIREIEIYVNITMDEVSRTF